MLSSLTRISLALAASPLGLLAQVAAPPQSNDAPVALPGLARTHAPASHRSGDHGRGPQDPPLHRRRRFHAGARGRHTRRRARQCVSRARADPTRAHARGRRRHLPPDDSALDPRARHDVHPAHRRRRRSAPPVPRLGARAAHRAADLPRRTAVRRLVQRYQRLHRLRRTHRPSAPLPPEDARGRVVVFIAPLGNNARPAIAFWQRDNLLAIAARRRCSSSAGSTPACRLLPLSARRVRRPHEARARAHRAARTRTLGETIFGRSLDSTRRRRGGQSRSADAPGSSTVRPRRRRTTSSAFCAAAIRSCATRTSRSARITITSAFAPPVDHDSIRAFNAVVRQRGADDPPPRHDRRAVARSPRAARQPARARPRAYRLDQQRRRRRRQRLGARARDRRGVRARRRESRSGRCCSSGTPPRRRGCSARSTSPIIRPCRAIRSSRRSTWIRWAAASRMDDPPGGTERARRHRLASSLDRAGRSRRDGERSATSTRSASTISSTRTAIRRTRTAAAITTCTRATAFRSCSSARPRGTSTTTW